jgi:hypothetical protein
MINRHELLEDPDDAVLQQEDSLIEDGEPPYTEDEMYGGEVFDFMASPPPPPPSGPGDAA